MSATEVQDSAVEPSELAREDPVASDPPENVTSLDIEHAVVVDDPRQWSRKRKVRPAVLCQDVD